jgi:succinyl-diaminopimelate desuccinylase
VTPVEAAALDQVERLTDEMVEFTRQLVRIPTINPPGDCYSACADLIASRLSEFGYHVELLPAD